MAALDELEGGGAPLLGEVLPIELANTRFAVRGEPRDGLTAPSHLSAWLRDNRTRLRTALGDDDILGVAGADLAIARQLRDAVHDVLSAVVAGTAPPDAAVDGINRVARSVPRWPQLRWGDLPTIENGTRGRPAAAAVAEIADLAVDLFAGPHGEHIRVCRAPGCVLFFLKNHPRRTWCSDGCGNRARVARFHARRLSQG